MNIYERLSDIKNLFSLAYKRRCSNILREMKFLVLITLCLNFSHSLDSDFENGFVRQVINQFCHKAEI